MNITFWISILSPHQAPVIRELSRSHVVTVVTTEDLQRDRVNLGWKESPIEAIEWIRASTPSDVQKIAKRFARPTHIHILGGIRGYNLAATIQRELIEAEARIGIISERPDTRGPLDYVRRAIYYGSSLHLRTHVDFLLAMGTLGQNYFVKLGWPPVRVFPYAYVTEHQAKYAPASRGANAAFCLVFLGQFSHRKGGDLLLRALSRLSTHQWHCIFCGVGDQLESWRALSNQSAIASRVEFLPPMSMSEVPQLLSRSDLLVLPSRFDGWGAVINEAMAAGVPAVCSSACGARDLLGGRRGDVFESNNIDSLAAVLQERIEHGPITSGERLHLGRWSECVSGSSVAHYLTDVLGHIYENLPRPTAPWLESFDSQKRAELIGL